MIHETQRLVLRPWRDDDAPSCFEYARDPDIGPWAGWPPHKSEEESLNIIRTVLNGLYCYAITEKGSDKAIGSIELMVGANASLAAGDDECELGYWIGKPFWGRGYMPEAARELLRYAFCELNMRAVRCGYYEGNDKSRRVQEKLGFKNVSRTEGLYLKLLDEYRTGYENLLTKEDWKKGFAVRVLEDGEIPSAYELIWRTFLKFEAPDYAPEGTAYFRKECLDNPAYLEGITYYGAFDGSRLTGVLGVRPDVNHICFLFVDGAYHRLGIASRLFEAIKPDMSGSVITVNSSPYGLPFYRAAGFEPTGPETVANGIRFTPMHYAGAGGKLSIVKLCDRPDLADRAACWFSHKWGIPEEAYRESIAESMHAVVPSWYLMMNGDRIAAGMGVIENDFHDRKDLAPNVCAVYTDPYYRRLGIAGKLLNYVAADMNRNGIDTLYLLTNHDSFYERYGWEYLCMAQGDGEETPSRVYVHKER